MSDQLGRSQPTIKAGESYAAEVRKKVAKEMARGKNKKTTKAE